MMKKKPSADYRRGRKMLKRIHGDHGLATIDAMKDIAPDLVKLIYEFPFGRIYPRPALDVKSRQLATLAALVALANARPQLKAHLHGALNVGWTRKQIVEVIMQLTIYAGFPAALNALQAAREVFKERRSKKRSREG